MSLEVKSSDRLSLRLVILSFTIIAALSYFGFFGPVDAARRWIGVNMHRQAPSGDIVFITVDSKDEALLGGSQVPRQSFAKAIDLMNEAQADLIAFDFVFVAKKPGDEILAKSIQNSKIKVVVAWNQCPLKSDDDRVATLNTEMVGDAAIGIICGFDALPQWGLRKPIPVIVDGTKYYPMYQYLAGRLDEDMNFRSTRMNTELDDIQKFSLRDVVGGRVPLTAFKGKRVLVGTYDDLLGDRAAIVGIGAAAGSELMMMWAEGERNKNAVDLGSIPALLIALIATAILAYYRRSKGLRWLFVIFLVGGFVVSTLLENAGIIVAIAPAVLFLGIVSGAEILRFNRERRSEISLVSGLPSDNAFYATPRPQGCALVVVKLQGPSYFEPPFKRLQETVKNNFGANIYHMGGTSFAAWIERGKINSANAAAELENLSNLKQVENFGIGIVGGGGTLRDVFASGEELAVAALMSGKKINSDSTLDPLATPRANKVSDPVSGQVLNLKTNGVAGRFVDMTIYSDLNVLKAEILKRLPLEYSRVEGDACLWVKIDDRALDDTSTMDHLRHAIDRSQGTPADVVIIVSCGSVGVEPSDIAMRSVSELRDAGFEVCLSGFGSRDWSLARIRSTRATLMGINQGIFSLPVEHVEAILSGAVHVSDLLGRLLLVEGVNTSEQLAICKWTKCDYAVGEATA